MIYSSEKKIKFQNYLFQDTFQKEKYGIVISANNLNCDTSCVSGQCYAGPGHGNDPRAQYCWGPGLKLQGGSTDYQCQKCTFIFQITVYMFVWFLYVCVCV